MAGKIYSGTYTTTIVLDKRIQQNPATLTGSVTVNGQTPATDSGFYSNAAASFSITNLGRISAYGATSYGILLLNGGTIQNGAAGGTPGSIFADETGILLSGTPSSVANDGTIIGEAGRGVFLQDGGTLSNAGGALIEGGFVGVAIYNQGGSLTNAGSIAQTGSAGLAVEMYAGTVANLAGGQIGGVYGVGFVARQEAGTLTNAGTITGSARDGVELTEGGTVSNTGVISGGIGGVLALYGAAAVSNGGSIGGAYAGLDLLAGGSVTNSLGGQLTGGFGVSFGNGAAAGAVGTLTNQGIITGTTYEGVALNAGGTVSNTGSIAGAAAGVAGFYAPITVSNGGSIGSGFIGVDLLAGGTLTNLAGGTITGVYGAVLANGTQSGVAGAGAGLANAGVITGTGTAGLEMLTNGDFINQAGGTISGGRYGVYIGSVFGTFANYGAIAGQTGLYSRAVVAGGTRYPAQVTLINGGTITGSAGVAVSMFASDDLLIDRPGAVFNGSVTGGGGRLELAGGGAGTLGGVASGLASFGTITEDRGASWVVSGTIATGAVFTDLGTLTVQNGATFSDRGVLADGGISAGTIALRSAGTFAVSGTVQSGITVLFGDSTGHLALTSPMTEFAPIAGFGAGATIALPNLAPSGVTESFTQAGNAGTLTLSQNGTVAAKLTLLGHYSSQSFALRADPGGGTDVIIPCFLAGTLIAAEGGLRRVERLRPGDRVLTASGALRPVVWVGRRVVDVARHRAPESVRPVRIVAHAFGPSVPARDLLLSPDHAVFWAGALIPVHRLINGRSVREGPGGIARYHHVELDRHDVLLAENLPVESFLDTGNRASLGLADGPKRRPARPCAAIALTGGAVARTRRHLLARLHRAGKAGGEPHAEHGVALEAAGRRVPPARRAGKSWMFLLPPEADEVVLRVDRPCALRAAFLDGVLLAARGDVEDEDILGLPPAARPAPRSLELVLER